MVNVMGDSFCAGIINHFISDDDMRRASDSFCHKSLSSRTLDGDDEIVAASAGGSAILASPPARCTDNLHDEL